MKFGSTLWILPSGCTDRRVTGFCCGAEALGFPLRGGGCGGLVDPISFKCGGCGRDHRKIKDDLIEMVTEADGRYNVRAPAPCASVGAGR